VRGRPFFGQPSAQGRRQASEGGSLDSLLEQFGPGVLLRAAEIMEGVELAYHRGEIYAALDRLPPEHKAYVLLRFWGGCTNSEIASALARPVNNMARTWTEAIKPKLRAELLHLLGAG
jgi:DNA-directed RNA polymerase specialized sigma24 family protein